MVTEENYRVYEKARERWCVSDHRWVTLSVWWEPIGDGKQTTAMERLISRTITTLLN